MEAYSEIMRFIDVTFVRYSFFAILFLLIARKVFKKLNYTIAADCIKWFFISYAIMLTLHLIIVILVKDTNSIYSTYFERATGPYKYWYWVITFAHTLLPLLLLIKKNKTSLLLLLVISLLMNMGWLFESMVIHVTTIHRDYLPPSQDNSISSLLPFKWEMMILLKGVLLGIFLLVIGNIKTFTQSKPSTSSS